ncbi:MAG: outer membrane lipoprotein carrier protein LolA [Bacteroidales bacterium]|jgi:outer membrane lipoprotein-sorting protein|nr:outer membrane lipoprotein carrier protein LolA [Bacteroidales bacterium]
MKKILPLIFTLITLSIQAQHLYSDANAILDKLSIQYKEYPSVGIQFTMRIEENKQITGKTNGEVLIKENMYKMTIPGQQIYCDGEMIWTYQKEVNEISIFEYDETDETMINPIKLLNNWKKNYTAKFIREETVNNRKLTLIDVTPIKQQSYFKIRIFVDEAKNEIVGFTLYEKDNSIYLYNFDKTITTQTPKKMDFQLKTADYPGAEINDMR